MSTVSANRARPYDPVSLSSFAFWEQPPGGREKAFATLRRERPISWQRPPEDKDGNPTAKPYWAIVKSRDIREIGLDTGTFCSGQGVQIDDVPIDLERRFVSFLDMDPPLHTQFRGLVQHAFGPRQIARMETALQRKCTQIVDRLLEIGPCDFVSNVAMELPLWAVCTLLGVPDTEHRRLAAAADKIALRGDPEFAPEPTTLIRALEEIEETGRVLARERMKEPTEDLLSGLTQATIDGRKLTLEEIISTFTVFILGANDNVRHTTSGGVKALCDFPDQRRLLMSDFDAHVPKAIEEILRWTTSTPTMRRTAVKDRVVRDIEIKAGDKVVLFYCSGNRDEDIFENPDAFDITRFPNRHQGFGGGGIHFCIGAPLTRLQLRLFLKELLHRVPDLEVGEPEYVAEAMMTGIKRMQCHFRT